MKMRKKIFTIHRSEYKDLTSYNKTVIFVKVLCQKDEKESLEEGLQEEWKYEEELEEKVRN